MAREGGYLNNCYYNCQDRTEDLGFVRITVEVMIVEAFFILRSQIVLR